MHGFDPLGKAFAPAAMQRGPKLSLHWLAYGYAPHRRREDAVLVQLLGSYRLRVMSISHSCDSNDPTNAFSSVSEELLMQEVPRMYSPHDWAYVYQRFCQQSTRVGDGAGAFYACPRRGILMGHSAAAVEFAVAYEKPLVDFNAWRRDNLEGGKMMVTYLRAVGVRSVVDLAFTAYADDTMSKTIARPAIAAAWAAASGRSSAAFEASIGEGGLVSNMGKRKQGGRLPVEVLGARARP